MSAAHPEQDRLAELLAQQALFGLNDHERRELTVLIHETPGVDREAFERMAAGLEVAGLTGIPIPGLPDSLVERVRSASERVNLDSLSSSGVASPIDRGSEAGLPFPPATFPGQAPDAGFGILSLVAVTGWVAAASLFVAVMFPQWFRAPIEGARMSPTEARDRWVADHADLIRLPWQATADQWATTAAGEIVWSSRDQSGFLTVRGLTPNNPTEHQYQLWIVDGDRKHPVDGGVFDIPSTAVEVVIPFDAKLAVATPTLFAVTVERPGGVVVSDQERVVLAASVP